jgi:hypothetical protein
MSTLEKIQWIMTVTVFGSSCIPNPTQICWKGAAKRLDVAGIGKTRSFSRHFARAYMPLISSSFDILDRPPMSAVNDIDTTVVYDC